MLTQLPLSFGASGMEPPARLPPGWKARFTARQAVDGVILAHAKAAPKVSKHPYHTAAELSVSHSRQHADCRKLEVGNTNMNCSHVHGSKVVHNFQAQRLHLGAGFPAAPC